MTQTLAGPSVVVGVDGSRAAAAAAVWAIDEAVGRGLALRLVAATGSGAAESASPVESAEAAVRSAAAAVAFTGRPDLPPVQTAVITAGPQAALLEQSRTAAMICVGLVGIRHFDPGRLGSTAGALIAGAHCPVAVIRAGRPPAAAAPGWVVVELDQTADSATVLQAAIEEARMRRAPLRVLGTWQSDDPGAGGAAESARVVRAQLDRRLETWTHRYPDLDVKPVAVHGSGLGFLADNADSIQLVVIGARNTAGVGDMLGPAGLVALGTTACAVLVIDPQRLL